MKEDIPVATYIIKSQKVHILRLYILAIITIILFAISCYDSVKQREIIKDMLENITIIEENNNYTQHINDNN